jgi:site-specific recombinase XerD
MAGLDSGVIWNVTEERVILPECPPCLRIDLMTYSLSQGDTFLRSFASLPSYRSAKNLVAHPVGVGTPLNPSKVVDRFKTLLKRAGLLDIRFHDLRHSSATILLSIGVHPKVVQELLGHNQISMTMDIYSHVLPTIALSSFI